MEHATDLAGGKPPPRVFSDLKPRHESRGNSGPSPSGEALLRRRQNMNFLGGLAAGVVWWHYRESGASPLGDRSGARRDVGQNPLLTRGCFILCILCILCHFVHFVSICAFRVILCKTYSKSESGLTYNRFWVRRGIL